MESVKIDADIEQLSVDILETLIIKGLYNGLTLTDLIEILGECGDLKGNLIAIQHLVCFV